MPIADILALITGEKQSSGPLPSSVQKRKADSDLQRTTDKLVRRDQPVASSSTPVAQIKKPANTLPAVVNPRPNAGTSVNSKVNPSTSSNGTGAATTSTAEPAKPPKKGSFAEILARAKVAQATLGKVGKIQHKAIEKGLSKRERQELKEYELQSHRVSKKSSRPGVRTHVRDVQNGARESSGKVSSKAPAIPEKKIKKAALATTGYTGTARPNPAAVKSSKPIPQSRATVKAGHGRSSSSRQDPYARENKEEEDEEEEEEEDYYSDASSDMEADVFEVDEEEERAARIARKEDEEALREEARHQRVKEEKRRRLTALAKAKR